MDTRNRDWSIPSIIFYSILPVFIITVVLSLILDNYPLLLAAIALAVTLIVLRIRCGQSVISKNETGLFGKYMKFRRKHFLLQGVILIQVMLILGYLIERPPLNTRLIPLVLILELSMLMGLVFAKGILDKESPGGHNSEDRTDEQLFGK